MKLAWMREYRGVVEKLIKYANVYAGELHKEDYRGAEVPFSFAQVQVLEYILENEDLHQNLTTIAARLGITYSTFSKLVSRLVGKGLLEKFHARGNRKDVIVRPTEKGRKVYDDYSKYIVKYYFSHVFKELDALPKEYLPVVAAALGAAARENTDVDAGEAPVELIPIGGNGAGGPG